MRVSDGEPLRIALLDHTAGDHSRELAGALHAAGHDAQLLGSRAVAPLEALLRLRGFTPALSHVPLAAAALWRGGFHVAHAFSAPDAAAALAWRRGCGRPVVFTCTETLDRGRLADARLRLWSLWRAVEDIDALLAGSEDARAAIIRWLAREAPVADARDAAAHERLYRGLLK